MINETYETLKVRLEEASRQLSVAQQAVRELEKIIQMKRAVEAGKVYREDHDSDYRYSPPDTKYISSVADVLDNHGSYWYTYSTEYLQHPR